MDSVTQLWKRIDTWWQTFAPSAQFSPGATPEELAEAEVRLGLTLPQDFKASYRIHNGDTGGSRLMGYPDFYSLSYVHSFAEIFQDHLQDAQWAKRKPGFVSDPVRESLPIQPIWCHPQWVTFAGDGSGYQWCIDLAPAPGGQKGQIIAWDHEDGPAQLLFSSFEALLSAYADQLEAGLYPGTNPVIPLEKLTHLKERRVAFQEPSPAKSLLHQTIRRGWEPDNNIEGILSSFRQVLQQETSTLEDRFFAYYGLITWCVTEWGYDDEVPSLFAQLESEAHRMPPTHWVHEEVALLPQT